MFDDSSTIDASAVQAHLAEVVRMGRSVAEAAGEILFLNDKQESLGTLPKQSKEEIEEIEDIVGEWLLKATDHESSATHRLVAKRVPTLSY